MNLARVIMVTFPIFLTFAVFYVILRMSHPVSTGTINDLSNEKKDGFSASFARKNYGKLILISSATVLLDNYVVRLIYWHPGQATAVRLTGMYHEVIPIVIVFLLIAAIICRHLKTNIIWNFLFPILFLSVGEGLLGFSNWLIAVK